MADYKAMADRFLKPDAKIMGDVKEMVEAAVNEGETAGDILDKGLIAGMAQLGERFKKNEVYVPEVLIAARAMNQAMEVLEPLLLKEGAKSVGKVAVGTVKGDLHDIGKNLVCMMLKGNGFEIVDLGVDVPADKFVAAADDGVQVIGLSALLTTTMPEMKTVISALRDAGKEVKVMVGGAPVTQQYCDEVGADGYAADAASAVDVAKSLIGV